MCVFNIQLFFLTVAAIIHFSVRICHESLPEIVHFDCNRLTVSLCVCTTPWCVRVCVPSILLIPNRLKKRNYPENTNELMPTVLTNLVVGNGRMTPSRPTDSRRCYEFVWRLPARQTTSDSYLIDQFRNSFVRHRKRQTVVCVCLLWIPNINFFDFSDSIFFGFVGQMPAMEMEDRKWRDREALKHIIGQWNANRLDLFSLSEPNEVCWNKITIKSCCNNE